MDGLQPLSSDDGFDIKEVDIAEYWSRTVEHCNIVAGWNLDAGKQGITNDMIKEKLMPEKSKKQEIVLKAVQGFQIALSVVNTLGQIVGQAAGTVIGPANQAANAISFVVGAIQNYNAVIAEIGDLMERLSDFLNRIQIYVSKGINPELRVTVYKVMDHFLYIMAAVYHLRGNWKNKLILKAKTLIIGKDNTIRNATARFELLVKRHTDRQIDVMSYELEAAGVKLSGIDAKLDGVADDTRYIIGAVDKAADATEKKERHKKITETLKIKVEEKNWLKRQDQHWSRAKAPDTGKWLLDLSTFTEWSSLEDNRRTLFIQAAPNHGKSVLSSYIIRHLKTQYREHPDVLVAYYYFQAQSDDAVNLALRSILYQIAVLQDTVYAARYSRFAEKVCKTTIDVDDTAELWRAFILDTRTGQSIDGTLFIILDGLDEIELKDAGKAGVNALSQILSDLQSEKKSSKGLQVHISLSAREDGFKNIESVVTDRIVLGLPNGPTDDFSYPNKPDLDSYVKFRLSNMAISKLRKREEVDQILTELESTLAGNVRGDWSILSLLLDLIEKSREVEHIKDVAKRAHDTRDEIIRSQIKALNLRLSKSEIAEVNEMLIWASKGISSLTVDQYKDLLTLETERTVFVDLEQQIRDRYTIFDIDDQKNVSIRFADWFATAKEEDISVVFEKGEVELVQRLLRTHFNNIYGSDELYKKYNFEPFFKDLLGTGATGIHVNVGPSYDHMARTCVAAIRGNGSNDFLRYALKYFLYHLDDADGSDKAASQAIGTDLVAILQDAALIERWMDTGNIFENSEIWPLGTSWQRSALYRWLRNSEGSTRAWVDKTLEADDKDTALVLNVAKTMAQHWLMLGAKWRDALPWLQDYLAQRTGYTTTKDVKDVALWTRSNVQACDQQWNKCLAKSFLMTTSWKQAIRKLQKALAIEPDNIDLQFDMAKALAGRKDYNGAIAWYLKIAEKLREEPAPEASTASKLTLDQVLAPLADCCSQAVRYNEAIPIYKERLDILYEQTDPHLDDLGIPFMELVKALFELGRYEEILEALARLRNESMLIAFIGWHGQMRLFNRHLQLAANAQGYASDLADIYDETLMSDEVGMWDMLALRCTIGMCKWQDYKGAQRQEVVELWEQNLNAEYESIAGATATVSILATAYVDAARDADWQETVVNDSAAKIQSLMTRYDRAWRSDPLLLLTRLYHLAGREDEARDCVRPYLKIAFTQMEEEPYNRQEALIRIGAALQHMDDDINACAAWQMIRPQEAPEQAVTEAPEDGDEAVDDDWLSLASAEDTPADIIGHTICDGECDEQWNYIGQAGDVYNCKDCIDVTFEAGCYKKLMDDKLLSRKACSPTHKFLYVPSLTEEQLKDMTPNQLMVGGRRMHKDEWVESMKVTWKLDEKSLREQREKEQERAKEIFVAKMRRRKTNALRKQASEEAASKSDDS